MRRQCKLSYIDIDTSSTGVPVLLGYTLQPYQCGSRNRQGMQRYMIEWKRRGGVTYALGAYVAYSELRPEENLEIFEKKDFVLGAAYNCRMLPSL